MYAGGRNSVEKYVNFIDFVTMYIAMEFTYFLLFSSRFYHNLFTFSNYTHLIKFRKGTGMAIEVFNRYEKKFLVEQEKVDILTERLSEYMEIDKYNRDGRMYTICNIYYDTPDDELIRRSIEGPVYKEKLRLRSYGTVGLWDSVFVEIKKKYKGIVNKRRTSMNLKEAYEFIENGLLPDLSNPKINRQVLKELEYFRSVYELVPKVCLCYDRMAFFAKDDGDFRVTFDTNVRARRQDVGLEYGDYGSAVVKDGRWIMEVKMQNSAPLWFTRLMSELEIYPASISKYGTEYKAYIDK